MPPTLAAIMGTGAAMPKDRHHRRHLASFTTVVRHIGVGRFTGAARSIGVHDLGGVHDGVGARAGAAQDGAAAGAVEVGECDAAGEPFRVVERQ